MCSRSTVFKPTANGSSRDACQASTPSGCGTRLISGTSTSSVMQPSDHRPMSFFVAQSARRPAEHAAQTPHGSDGLTATADPTSDASTPSPTLATRPAKSWPGTLGNGVSTRPSYWWASVPHSDADSTRTTTQPGRATGSGRSSSSTRPTPASTTARMSGLLRKGIPAAQHVKSLLDVPGEMADDDGNPVRHRLGAEIRNLDRPAEDRRVGCRQARRDRAAGACDPASGDSNGGRRVAQRVVADLLAEEERQLGVLSEPLDVAEPHQRADGDVRDHLGDGPTASGCREVHVSVADASQYVVQTSQSCVRRGGAVGQGGTRSGHERCPREGGESIDCMRSCHVLPNKAIIFGQLFFFKQKTAYEIVQASTQPVS